MMEDIGSEMRRMQCEMEQLFGESFGWAPWAQPLRLLSGKSGGEIMPYQQPTMDVRETDKDMIAELDLPGIDKKDIELDVDEHSLKVNARRSAERKEEKTGFYRHERSYQGFYRAFPLPAKVMPDKAAAEYKDGVLSVTMPKAEPAKNLGHKRIDIQ